MSLKKERKDIIATMGYQLWRLFSSPLIMLLIPLFLTDIEQGYWYLFGSIAAMSTLVDLGFSNIILQFSAHEFAYLSFADSQLVGDSDHLRKLGSFLRFSIKWIGSLLLVAYPIIFLVGCWFFIRDGVFSLYIVPWIVFSFGSSLNFFNNSILSFIEGMDKIHSIQNIRLRVGIINTIVIVLFLLFGKNIYALAFGSIISASSIFISLFGTFGKILRQLFSVSKENCYQWKKEVMPLFVRYALSFASGFFIFQIYTPLTHFFYGPIEGGKVGISMTLVNAMFTMSTIWIYTVTPKMNILVSLKEKKALDSLFRKRFLFSIGTYLFFLIGLICFVFVFQDFWIFPKIFGRFLPPIPLLILLLCYFMQVAINSWAVYLRAHKKEPFVIPSILTGIWVLVGTVLAGNFLPVEYFFIGLFTSYIWGAPLCYYIFRTCKKRWYEV